MLVGCTIGSAVAAAHLRSERGQKLLQEAPGLFWVIFAYVALCSAGPFALTSLVYATRRLPAWGLNWMAVSIPWLVSVPWTSSHTSTVNFTKPFVSYEAMLTAGTLLASLVLVALGYRLSQAEPQGNRRPEDGLTSWIGLILTGLWPIQLALNLILASP